MLAISRLPAAGLGNKLFAWAAGALFAKRNGCRHITLGMTRLHIGTFLRKERSKRFYIDYFKSEQRMAPVSSLFSKKVIVPQQRCDEKANGNHHYIFEEMPHWSDMFITIKNYRSEVVAAYWNDLTDKVKSRIQQHKVPYISVHIRMGDFRTLKPGEDFGNVGLVRTPMDYFIQTIDAVRQQLGFEAPITVFSDGTDAELETILALPAVTRAPDDLDIVHLTVMSKSRIIIMSAGSSFSYWAGFLSEAILIKHYQHLHQPIRDAALNARLYEGPLTPGTPVSAYPLLEQNLQQLKAGKVSFQQA